MFIVAIVICNYRKSIIRAQYYVFFQFKQKLVRDNKDRRI